MDRAPLRPIPARPSTPVSDAQAVRQVTTLLPEIGAREGLALALVALVGRDREEVAQRVGLDEESLGAALAYARKELRRTVVPLPGSGWCERAERLISDRLDGALSERGTRRLDVHLRNCPRCVEHERRLVQATDGLVAGVTPLPGQHALVEAAPIEEARGGAPETAEPQAVEAIAPIAPAETVAPVAEAEPPAPPPLPRPLRELGVVIAWRVLLVLAIVLAVASLALAVAGILGAEP